VACTVTTDIHAVTYCSNLPNTTYYIKVYRSGSITGCSNSGISCTQTRYKLKVRNLY